MADSSISGPLYFFDQPPRIQCRKRARRSIHSSKNHSINPPLESKIKSIRPKSDSESAGDGEISGESAGKNDGKGQGDVLVDANEQSSITDERYSEAPSASQLEEMSGESSLLEEYQLTAPQLLLELEKLLKKCRGREEGFFPQGLTNVLNYTWQDLTAGAVHFYGRQRHSCADKIIKLRKPKSVTSDKLSADTTREKTANIKKKIKKKINVEEKLLEESCSLRGKPTVSSGHKSASQPSTIISFSISSEVCREQGWIVQLEDAPSDDPQWTALCCWAVERLRQAQIPINEQNAKLVEQGFRYTLVLHHYGDSQRDWASKQRRGVLSRPLPPYCRPSVPESRADEPAPLKLHYRINDGTSFLYYPSGHVAVCQAHSGSPSGGFSTIVFGDGTRASILATFTPFGHATVTHQLSGALTMWDQHGGVAYDPSGAVIREWTWPSGGRRGKPITVEVTELISVRAWNATSATLWFRADRERIQLSVSCLPNAAPPKHMVEVRSSVELSPLEAETVEAEPGKRWGVDEELRRLQRSVRNILEGWLEHYRQATGISQSKVKTWPACSSHGKPKSQSAALPSLGLEEVCQSPEGSADLLETGRTLSPELRQSKELLPHVTETGALRVQSNIRLEPVPIPRGSDRGRPAAVPPSPCPAAMRAVLTGQEAPQQCHCSNRRTPLLTDLEYDAFVRAQSTNEQQILVVCVTPTAPPTGDALDQLYRAKNKNRSLPCTQCQQDSFRLLRYELPTAHSPTRTHNALLHRKNNIAPGMFLMYGGGRLLFADHIFNGYSCSAKDLHKQIAKTRAAYCKGQTLPSDFRFSPPLQALQGPVGNSAKSAERHTPQTPLRSRKAIPETYDRAPPALDSFAPLTLRRSLQEQAKRTLPVTLPILPTEQSLHRAGPVTLAPGFISDR